MYAIRDKATKEVYRRAAGRSGWYGHDLWAARLYSSRQGAERVISRGGHHVTYPGTRELEVVPVQLTFVETAH